MYGPPCHDIFCLVGTDQIAESKKRNLCAFDHVLPIYWLPLLAANQLATSIPVIWTLKDNTKAGNTNTKRAALSWGFFGVIFFSSFSYLGYILTFCVINTYFAFAFADRKTNWDVVVRARKAKKKQTRMIANGMAKETATPNESIGGNGGGPGKKSSKDIQKQLSEKLDSTSSASV